MLVNLTIISYRLGYFNINNEFFEHSQTNNRFNNTRWWLVENYKRSSKKIEILISDKVIELLNSTDYYQQIVAIKLIENKAKIKLI